MSGRKQFNVTDALDRAMRVFWECGYADTSLNALESATGLARSSLYSTFGGKDALFRQCLERYAATYGARYEQALTTYAGEPVRAIEAYFDVVLARIADPAVPKGCLIAQSAAQSANLREEGSKQVRALLDTQRRRVRAALADSGAEPRILDELAGFVVAVQQSLAVLSCAGSSDAELRVVVRLACRTVADTLTRTEPGRQSA
ncbi:TetR/AcrR family transcriptional regulator [Streptomyces shenzhenensis]